MKHSCKLFLLLVTLALGVLAPTSHGASITQTYSGPLPGTITDVLPDQGTALELTFTLPALSNLTMFTSSYATGGFQPNLFLFNAMGSFIAAGVPAGSPDPTTGLIGDTSLTALSLAPGTYTVALTDFLLNQSITATSLSDGFTDNFGNGTTFLDANGNTRTGAFELTIAPSAIPEPSTLWLAAPVLAWLGVRARSSRRN